MRIFYLGLMFLLSGCVQAGLDVINLPASFDNELVIHDVSYGPEPEQKLDVYMPVGDAQKKRSVVVFFYGGRWTSGAKEDYRFIGTAFADQGFVVVIPDYRKYPQVHFPVFVQDGAKSLAWVYDNIENYNGSQDRIYVVGHSAGAHIGALLTADAHYMANEGKNRSDVIRGFAGLSGPYAFTPDERLARRLWALHRNAMRYRYLQLGLPVSAWVPGQPLQVPFMEIQRFRRTSRRVHS